jgi:hypothetical protein
MSQHEDFIDSLTKICIHYNGDNETCGAGVDYRLVKNYEVEGIRESYPCFAEGICNRCDFRRFPTKEEAERTTDELVVKMLIEIAKPIGDV